MADQSFEVVVNVNLDTNLGFQAQSCIVDNLTAAWCYIPSGQRFVPPWTAGTIMAFPATQRARVTWRAPDGLINPGNLAGQTATVRFLDAHLDPQQGNSNLSGTGLVAIKRDRKFGDGSAVTVQPTQTGFIFIGFDQNVQALIFLFSSTGATSPGPGVTLEVAGLQAGAPGGNSPSIVYWPAQRALPMNMVPISGALENPTGGPTQANARVKIVNGDAVVWKVDILDVYVNALQVVSPLTGTTWDVSDRAARVLGAISPAAASVWDVSDRAARQLGKVQAGATNTLRVANGTVVGFNQLIAGVAGQTIKIYKGAFWLDLAVAVFLDFNNAAGTMYAYSCYGNQMGPHAFDADGLTLSGVGEGFGITQSGAGAPIVRGFLTYRQDAT